MSAEGFPAPTVFRQLAPGTRARLLGELQFRGFARDMLNGYPSEHCAPFAPTDIDSYFAEFLDAAYHSRHPMDWTLHLEFAMYHRLQSSNLWLWAGHSAAKRWVRTVNTPASWVVITVPTVHETLIIGERARSTSLGPRLSVADSPGLTEHALPSYQVGNGTPAPRRGHWQTYSSKMRGAQHGTPSSMAG